MLHYGPLKFEIDGNDTIVHHPLQRTGTFASFFFKNGGSTD
jgi:hypothetical protein